MPKHILEFEAKLYSLPTKKERKALVKANGALAEEYARRLGIALEQVCDL